MKRYLLVIGAVICLFILPCLSSAQFNQIVPAGGTTTPINFTGSGCVYSWVNDQPGIGLAASGSGNIPAFTAVNTGVSAVTATIRATPTPTGFAYIANFGANTVTVLSTATNTIVSEITVGAGPQGVTVSPDGSLVYVTCDVANQVAVINTATNAVIANIDVGLQPGEIAVSPDGSKVYVTNFASNTVSVINTANNAVIATIPVGSTPQGIAISPDGSKVYVASQNGNIVTVINTATNLVSATIPGAGYISIIVSPDGSKVYATSQGGKISVISTATNTISATITTSTDPHGLAFSPNGSTLYVTDYQNNVVNVINAANNTVITTVPVGAGPQGVSVSPDGGLIYVANGDGNVSVISAAYNVVVQTIPVGSNLISLGNFVRTSSVCSSAPVTYTITVSSDPDATTPTITTTPATGSIAACVGSASASPHIQQFTVSGSNLTDVITATAPPGFQISFTPGGPYGSSVSLAEAAGITFNTPLYVRSAATDPAGNIAGNVVLSTPGGTSQNVAVTGVVNPIPTVNTVPNQTVNNGSATAAINFTGTGNTFTWTNNTPSIGLPASGSGNIPTFTATNNGAAPVTATITVTPALSGYAYIADGGSNTVTVINTATNMVTGTITVGGKPTGVTVSKDGRRVYVANFDSNTVSVIDAASSTVIATISVGTNPDGIVVTPDGKTVYVANTGSNYVSVIDAATNTVTSTIAVGGYPIGEAISPDGSLLYVSNDLGGSISVINTANNTVTATIAIAGGGPFGMAVSPDGGHLYVADTFLSKISVIDTKINTEITTIPLPLEPLGVSITPDGSRIYVSTNPFVNSAVYAISTASNSIIDIIPVGTAQEGISVTPDGSSVYVDNFGSNAVNVISIPTDQITTTIPAGQGPASIGTFISAGASCPGTPITFTITVNSGPVITAGPVTGIISACQGTPSESPNIQQFTVSGSLLTGAVTATAPAGFEVSLSTGGGFGNTVSITPVAGAVTTTAVYVRSAASATGNISGIITLSSQGAANQSVPVSGTINPLPTMNAVTNQLMNAGTATPPINFTGAANSFTWTNSNPSIGLPASGTGNIPAFTAINNNDIPVTATITVIPANTTTGCSGSPVSFIITVNPGAAQSGITAGAATGFISACAGTPSADPQIEQINISASNLTGNITAKAPAGFEISASPSGGYGNSLVLTQSAGTVKNTIVYVRSAGSAPSGHISGNIVLSSPGTPDQTVAVTGFISPVITVDPVSNQAIKAGTSTTAINFTGTGNSYTWTNNTPGIGLAASGTNGIPAFTGVNTGTTPITATITVTPLPAAYAYVPNYNRNVNVINILTGDVIGTVPVGVSPESVAISPDGSHVYICDYNSDDISVVDAATNTVSSGISTGLGTGPYYIAISPDGTYLYVACSTANEVLVISTATKKIVSTITVGSDPLCITPSPDGSKLYITDFSSQTISVVSTSSFGVVNTIPLNYIPYATAISPDGSKLYVAISGSYSRVQVINTTTGNVIADIPVGTSAQSIAITPDGSKVYVTDSNANTVTVISTATNSIITTIPVDSGPFGIAVSPDGGLVCVTNGNGNDVSVISTATDQVIRTVHSLSALALGGFVTGGSGCLGPPVTFTITVNPILPPSFTATADLQGLSTTYGIPSASKSFTISGANLVNGVVVTAPPGFEVSTDNIHFSPTVTVGSAGSINAAPVYVRLAATTPAGTSYTGNIVLTTSAVADIDVNIPNSVVNKAPLIITADNKTKPENVPNPELTVTYTGFVNGDGPGQLTIPPTITTTATTGSAVGKYPITAIGAQSPNYTFTYVDGTLTVAPSLQFLIIPNAFTPNGDGVNDIWNIPQLAYYPNCLVSIFTRYGSLVFQSKGYGTPWDGTYKGSQVPVGTYYYIIDPKQDGQQPLSGFVAVLR